MNNKRRPDIDNVDTSPLFPYPFVFRSREQLNEHISIKLKNNPGVYRIKLFLGPLTLILPMLNVFMVYRSLIYQREDFADIYSTFHSIIFYGEFTMVHVLLLGTFILFLYDNRKSSYPSKGQWINLLDLEFTLMAFNMIKLIPILSLNGFNFLMMQISICTSVFIKYSRTTKIICFTLLGLLIFIQIIILIGLLILLNLVKVYQVSFVGEITNPLQWPINQWLLFIGFAANIINITDTPTISQLSFMWDLTNKNWSDDSDFWVPDHLGPKRKSYIVDKICENFGFIKTFLWIRTMSAIDLHALVRLTPSIQHSSEHI